jgi:hypothetical protein
VCPGLRNPLCTHADQLWGILLLRLQLMTKPSLSRHLLPCLGAITSAEGPAAQDLQRAYVLPMVFYAVTELCTCEYERLQVSHNASGLPL